MMRFAFTTFVIATAIFSSGGSASAAEDDVPSWLKAAPGTQAFLGDDGGGAETATVCDTADRYRDWIAEKHPPGCRTFNHYLPVVIESVSFDPVKNKTQIHDANLHNHVVLPIAKIRIPSKQFIGYLHLDSLHPAIPSGTTIHLKNHTSDRTFELHESAKYSEKHGVDLGDHFSARVIKYDPTSDDEWDLHVTILDGEHSGQSGWLSAWMSAPVPGPVSPLEFADVDDGHGHSIGGFTNNVFVSSVQTPFDCNDLVPHSDAYESGNFDAAFKELQPLAIERCAEAEHLLGVMYAQGRGVQKDFTHAYAFLLLAYSDGGTPVGKTALIPVLGDDEHELEIVQFGAQLTSDELDAAETLAKQLAQKKGKLANPETAGPAKLDNSIKELRPRVAGYKLNGELATIELPGGATPISEGMRAVAPDYVVTQIVTENNANIIPVQLAFAEMKLSAVGHGVDYASKSDIDQFGVSQGERFAWLSAGARVRVGQYAVNGGFAAQVNLLDESTGQRYWVNHCFLTMQSEADRVLWRTADAGYCEAHGF